MAEYALAGILHFAKGLHRAAVDSHAGAFDHRAAGSGMPGAPHVVVRGFSLWGSVGVRRKNRKRPGQ